MKGFIFFILAFALLLAACGRNKEEESLFDFYEDIHVKDINTPEVIEDFREDEWEMEVLALYTVVWDGDELMLEEL